MSTEKIQSRKTLYKGELMRSRLEADYAAHLDKAGLIWKYEPKCFAGPKGQWLPDFEVDSHYVELKPSGLFRANLTGETRPHVIDDLLTRMTVAWDSEPGACLQLTYWEYAVGSLVTIESWGQGTPWMVRHRDMLCPMLWIGMGQFDRCRHSQVSGG